MFKLLNIAVIGLALLAGGHKISSVENSGNWVYMYDDQGRRYKSLSAASVGEVKGFNRRASGRILQKFLSFHCSAEFLEPSVRVPDA